MPDHPLVEGFRAGVSPPKELPLPEWAEANVWLPNSQHGSRYLASAIPAHADILEDFRDTETYEIAVVACTGFGKTTIFEVCNAFIVAEEPGDCLMVGQTEDMVRDWVKSRMRKVWETSPCTKALMPSGKDRFSLTNSSAIFRHMNWFAGAANETTLQEKSVRYTMADEPWQYKSGSIQFLLRRHHDRWNRKALLQSQAGIEGSEWSDFAHQGKWMDFHHRCPKCHEYQQFRWDAFQFEVVRDGNEELDWPAIYSTVRLRCQHCGLDFDDSEKNRREWAQGKYVWNGNRHVPNRITRNCSFLTVWRISWADVVKEWLIAQDAKRAGDLMPLQQIITQRFAQFWVEPSDTPILEMRGDPYRKQQYHEGGPWDGEAFRFLTVDVQKGHFWVVIRAWKLGGESRLLWEGRIDAWENISYLQDRYHVENRCVFIDARYDTDEVAKRCILQREKESAQPWNMTMGEDSDGNMVAIRKRRYRRVYSDYVRGRSMAGVVYRFIKFSNLLAKNRLAALMAGDGFGVPADVSRHYKAQIQSEKKVEKKPGKWEWQPVKKSHSNNHLWDCEVLQVVAACIFKVLESTTPVE